jgi:hypothetical protein
MTPDTDNEYGVAALFVVPSSPTEHGMNYVLYTDGTGAMMANDAGGLWTEFDALPTQTTLALNEDLEDPEVNETYYIATKALAVDIADVVEWTPWTIYMNDGTWYYRSVVTAEWSASQTPEAAAANPTGSPSKLPNFVDPEE